MEHLLNELASEFQHWRSTRPNRSVTPTHLKEKISDLLNYFSKATLAKRLGVNHQFINRIEHEQAAAPTFVALPIADATDQPKVIITYKNTRMELSSSPSEVVALVKLLEGEA